MTKHPLYDIIRERILVLDGGLGTMIQAAGVGEKDLYGDRFAGWQAPLTGCNDLLVLTAPHLIRDIHRRYLDAGADIISTDTFNANRISLADYRLEDYAYEINKAGAILARAEANEYTRLTPHKPRFVGGSVGPTGRTASMSADVNDPAAREVTFDTLVEIYGEQIRGLLDGGVDLIMLETFFDTLNAKAAIFAYLIEKEKRGSCVPIIVSGTLADASGRTLSGQTVEAFYNSIAHAQPLAVGFNCSFGARQLHPYLARLAAICRTGVSAYPNAGLPNVMGGYDETAEMFAADVEKYMEEGLVNLIGGCCGTTPAHIAAVAAAAKRYRPRPFPDIKPETVLSGLEPLKIVPEANFINIGERANVAGSAKFARLIREGDFEQAVGIARAQVESGAQIIDVCMDDGLIDGPAAMTHFLNLAASEPEIARVPLMIDSSSWETLEAGLKCSQGKPLVNSISLKEGEQEFLRKSRLIRRYGAAAVVMLFDEQGQADTYDRKIEVAGRAYGILTADGFPCEDIIFDPNVLSIATGIPEHDRYGVAFIEACRWIKQNLPGAKVSAGVSNLSFAFRGNNPVREAMHSVFLFHAIKAGLDMGIVNPGMIRPYEDIDPELLALTEEVVLNLRPEAGERLTAYAQQAKGSASGTPSETVSEWRKKPVQERISYAMTRGVTDHISEDILEIYNVIGSPLKVIDEVLMPAMSHIGKLFGEGKMFLPQVVKTARVMKSAVDVLTPYIQQGSPASKSAGRVLIATVKGDVHDIGKNIVSVVMSCNGYEVIDLGVMVDAVKIVDEAVRAGADIIGLSGLISPSLTEMITVVRELEKRKLRIPVIVGGATTSNLHTAVKIATEYSGVVIRSRDASENIVILNNLLGKKSAEYIELVKKEQHKLKEIYENSGAESRVVPLDEARKKRFRPTSPIEIPLSLDRIQYRDYSKKNVIPYINWTSFLNAWGIKGKYPDILTGDQKKAHQAQDLLHNAEKLLTEITDNGILKLNGYLRIFPARAECDDILIYNTETDVVRLPMLRSQTPADGIFLSLADFIRSSEDEWDYVGLFAVTSGAGLKEYTDGLRSQGDEYNAVMAKLLADRLAEGFAEELHSNVRRIFWGYSAESSADMPDILAGRYQGIRVAVGYPSCPDHSLKRDIFDLLNIGPDSGMHLTENNMIDPGESVCGLLFSAPEARYFGIGRIGEDQAEDYARRRGIDLETLQALIPQHIR